jgi:hypothetical protein
MEFSYTYLPIQNKNITDFQSKPDYFPQLKKDNLGSMVRKPIMKDILTEIQWRFKIFLFSCYSDSEQYGIRTSDIHTPCLQSSCRNKTCI